MGIIVKIIQFFDRVISGALALLLAGYQKTISPDHGLFSFLWPYGYCKFYPSCSDYAKKSLDKKGLRSLPKIITRLLACRPSGNGGIDLP